MKDGCKCGDGANTEAQQDACATIGKSEVRPDGFLEQQALEQRMGRSFITTAAQKQRKHLKESSDRFWSYPDGTSRLN
jgi:hypothetical protein